MSRCCKIRSNRRLSIAALMSSKKSPCKGGLSNLNISCLRISCLATSLVEHMLQGLNILCSDLESCYQLHSTVDNTSDRCQAEELIPFCNRNPSLPTPHADTHQKRNPQRKAKPGQGDVHHILGPPFHRIPKYTFRTNKYRHKPQTVQMPDVTQGLTKHNQSPDV
jgi:hypothetical protein